MRMRPVELCSRFESCSVNACPLDPDSALHGGPCIALDDDPETRCTATRAARERVAVQCGYSAAWARTEREIRRDAAKARWNALPAEERDRRTATLRLTAFRGFREAP